MKVPALGHWSLRRDRAAATGTVVPIARRQLATRLNPRRWLRFLGWPGIVGLGLLVMSAAFYISTLQPAELQMHETQQSAIALREQIRLAAQDMNVRQRAPAEQLAEFYRLFPDEKELPDWLGKIFAAAQSQGLVLEQGEYKATRDKTGQLMRHEITLPVKGEYPQIRKFLSSLPTDVPAVGLEQIQFERQKVGTATVESKIRLVLYLEPRP